MPDQADRSVRHVHQGLSMRLTAVWGRRLIPCRQSRQLLLTRFGLLSGHVVRHDPMKGARGRDLNRELGVIDRESHL